MFEEAEGVLGLKTPHLDDFTLLRYVADDLDDTEREKVAEHLEACAACKGTCDEIEELDRELAALAQDGDSRRDFEIEDLPEGDPFRRRPRIAARARRHPGDPAELAARAVAASEEGAALSTVLLDAAKTSAQELQAVLARLEISDPAHRFALLYALQEAGKQIAENPTRFLGFAESVATNPAVGAAGSDASDVETMVPVASLFGQAHQLAARACLWSGNLAKAASHLTLSYSAFAMCGDEAALARVELVESQRRFFAEDGQAALALARRAIATFEILGLEEERARGFVTEGMALFQLGKAEEALSCFRRALPVFEERGLWSNYVGAVNSASHCLIKMGRLPEARREYARALRRLSRDRHHSWIPFIRKGLAESLFAAERYREAAVASGQAARLYREDGQISRSLMASLFEIESWARSGQLSRAQHRLELFREEIARHGMLDSTLQRLIDEALSGASPDFREIARLRQSASEALGQRFGTQLG